MKTYEDLISAMARVPMRRPTLTAIHQHARPEREITAQIGALASGES